MQDAFREADDLEQRGRHNEAIEILENVIREGKEQTELYYKLALLKQETGDLKGALSDFQSAGRLDPKDKTIFYNSGVLLYKSGDLKHTEEEFQKAVKLDPGYADALYGLGLVSKDRGDKKQASDYFKLCLDYNPDFIKARKKLEEVSLEGISSNTTVRQNSSSRKKTVVVMELLYHWDYFITTVNLLKQDYNVAIIAGKSFKEHLDKNYNFNLDEYKHLLIDRINFNVISEFLKRAEAEALFINTIQGYEVTNAFANFVPPVPFYVTIHNFDLWLGLRPISGPNQPGANQINQTYRQSCKRIIGNASALISIDENVREFVSPKFQAKPVYVLPWVVNYDKIKHRKIDSLENKILFTIPASIEQGRRNYGVVLEAVKRIGSDFPNVSFVLLGRPVGEYGKNIIQSAKDINKQVGRDALIFFNSYIHQDVYSDYLKRSDFFILPLANLNIFGKYKSSAAMFDALVQGRPLLVPAEMNFSEGFAQKYGEGFIVYDDLSQTIKEIMQSSIDETNKLQKSAAQNANRFYIKNQRKIIKETIFTG